MNSSAIKRLPLFMALVAQRFGHTVSNLEYLTIVFKCACLKKPKKMVYKIRHVQIQELSVTFK